MSNIFFSFTVNCYIRCHYLINGERRYRELKHIYGEDFDNVSVNCIIDRRKSTFNDELALNQIVDNMVRENLTHYEQAKAFQALNDNGMSYTKIASACGLSKSTVSNIVPLLDGSDTIKEIYPMVDDVVSLSSLIRKEKDYPDEVARFLEKVKEEGSATSKNVTVQVELENGTKLWVYPTNELTASIGR